MFPATLITAGALGLGLIVLTVRVIQLRLAGKVSLGDGGDTVLLARSRAHANFAEYVPLALILMLVIEGSGGGRTPWPLWLAGAVLVIGRALHAWGMELSGRGKTPNKPRVFGMVLTLATLLCLSVWAVGLGLSAAA